MTIEKVALITAGGSDMGAGAVKRLAVDGFKVGVSSLIGWLASDGGGFTGQNWRIDGGLTRGV